LISSVKNMVVNTKTNSNICFFQSVDKPLVFTRGFLIHNFFEI
jgi:hypothetical protein